MNAFLRRQRGLIFFLYLCLLSLIPVFYTLGKLKIGGDIIIPLDLAPIGKYLYQWLNIQNGAYYFQNYFPLYLLYWLISFFRLSIYETSALIYFLINFIGGYGVYKITKLIDEQDDKPFLRLIPVTFYLLSPALLNGWHYLYFYASLPWFFYLIFKIIAQQQFNLQDLLGLQIVIFFSSLDLPNPKYLFYLFMIAAALFLISSLLGHLKTNHLRRLLWSLGLLIGMNLYLILPLTYFALHYHPADYGIHVKDGYFDIGKMMDYGTSTAEKMLTLHHGTSLNGLASQVYGANPFVHLAGYIAIFIIISGLYLSSQNAKYHHLKLLLSSLIIIFLFFAIGPNPPFGFIYEYLVTKVSLLAFLRTTAGAVFILSLLYSLYCYLVILENDRHQSFLIMTILVSLILTSYPLLTGSYYNNLSELNTQANINERGFKIPNQYFAVADRLNHLRLDQKTLIPYEDSSYIRTSWGYFGPPLYYFMYDNYPIFKNNLRSAIENHNVGIIFFDRNLFYTDKDRSLSDRYSTLFESGKVQVLQTNRQSFLPHFQISESSSAGKLAVLEFKKINPTKYRLIIHRVKNNFRLIFSEAFHPGWKLYSADLHSEPNSLGGEKWRSQYKILDGNDTDQATAEEMSGFIKNGYLTTLGDYSVSKETPHYRWSDGRKTLDYQEKYYIDFVSKNYRNTIQNNNLPNGSFYETWLKNSIGDNHHQVINQYANSWDLDLSQICNETGACSKNSDNSYDLELVVEFEPQRIFYLSLILSGFTTIGVLFYSLIDRLRRYYHEK